MAKETTLKDLSRALKLAVEEATSRATAEAIGEYTETQVRRRTRTGKGVDKFGGKQTKLRITDTTKKIRRALKKKGKLSPKTSPAKANLTRTGDMLDSLHYDYNESDSILTVQVGRKEQRKANELEQHGHGFLNLTRGEFKKVIEIMVESIVKKLNKSL